ncbi:MAG: DUF975 family protein [Bacteroidaceae bacterium]|nr:DUF975 family protein [Bacteroidaceae bacterium]
MSSLKSFRDAGWAQLNGNWGKAAVVTFVYIVLSAVISTLESTLWNASLFTYLFIIPVAYSYNVLFLDNLRTGKELEVKSIFDGFNDYTRVLGTYLLVYIYTILWTLLLIIPGIIKSLSYSMVPFVLKDNPELSFNAAIERSMAMMEGHKWEYFCLILTFIGWFLLIIITAGIASLWVTPYMSATFANYYEAVKAEYETKTAA